MYILLCCCYFGSNGSEVFPLLIWLAYCSDHASPFPVGPAFACSVVLVPAGWDRRLSRIASVCSQLEQLIEGLLSEHQITPPWKSAAGIASAGEQNSGGLWSPETQQQPASSGKLWLPGQE